MAPILIDKNGVKLYVRNDEHLPPHVHAQSGDDVAMIDIRTGEILKGDLESKKLRVVQEWLSQGENRKLVEERFYQLNPELRAGARLNPGKKKKK